MAQTSFVKRWWAFNEEKKGKELVGKELAIVKYIFVGICMVNVVQFASA